MLIIYRVCGRQIEKKLEDLVKKQQDMMEKWDIKWDDLRISE